MTGALHVLASTLFLPMSLFMTQSETEHWGSGVLGLT